MQVSLRKITEEDTDNIVKWRNSQDVRQWLYSQVELTNEMHLEWFKNMVCTGRCIQYIITLKEGNKCCDIGTTFIKRANTVCDIGEFGIFIGESWARGKHCALPATKEMLNIGFREHDLQSIFLTVFEDNVPAVHTYLKAGFIVTEKYPYDGDGTRTVLKMEIDKDKYKYKYAR